MSDRLQITLPWAVVVRDNGSAKFGVVKGRMVLTKRYREAKEKAHLVALGSCRGRMFGKGVPVRVRVEVYPPDARRRDIANLLKFTMDVLCGAAFHDDDQIQRIEVERCSIMPNAAQVYITVEQGL